MDLKINLNEKDKLQLLQRFIRYVAIDTGSDENSGSFPSTARQWDLLRLLEKEMKELGLEEVSLDEKGYLFGSLPSNLPDGKEAPVIGYLAHIDTYGGTSGKDVKTRVIQSYGGGDISLPGKPGALLKVEENPLLERCIGHTLITTDGTTLLGADDKAGVASIMTTADWFIHHPEVPHGKLRIGFTPDEETGNGTRFFDVKRFGAYAAYTFDGSALGEIEDETFCGDSASVKVTGYDIHPGLAKDKMINALRVLADIINHLPASYLPETTEGRESYLHPIAMSGEVGEATLQLIVRGFTVEDLHAREQDLIKVAKEAESAFPGAKVDVDISESYRNMKVVLDKYPKIVELAMEAVRKTGTEPTLAYIRGGTDGSALCFKGLPAPNIFTGGMNYHGVKEWASLNWMAKSVETGLYLANLWSDEKPKSL